MLGCNHITTSCGVDISAHGKRKKKSSASCDCKRTKAETLVSSATNNSLYQTADDGYTAYSLLNNLKQRSMVPLQKEFFMLRNDKIYGSFNASLATDNLSKNRYTDVQCLDQTRVVLSAVPGSHQSSNYINANHVDGYKQKNAYIATQGPLPNTCKDFWQMVWEQKVYVIVMTTRVMEKGHTKCAQYWPKRNDKTITYGNFAVLNKKHNMIEQFLETELVLCNLTTKEHRTVTHLLFLSWPDHGVPSSAKEFLSFMFHIREKQAQHVAKHSRELLASESNPHPIVIHCSAGIGRTGTFMTVDIACHQLTDTGRVNIFGTVKKIRSQRAFSIQTVDQYIFCHKALLEYAEVNGLLCSPLEEAVTSGNDKEGSSATGNRQSQQPLPYAQVKQTQPLQYPMPQGMSLAQQPLPQQPLQEAVLPQQQLSQQPRQDQLLLQQSRPDVLLPHLQQQPLPGLPMPEQPMQED